MTSPPAGKVEKAQAPRTSGFTIGALDLKTQIPMQCPAPTTVVLPLIDVGFPKGYAVRLQNIGGAAVTVTAAAGSPLVGPEVAGGVVTLAGIGDWAKFEATKAGTWSATRTP
jgi:hypothetical protein